MRSEIAGSLFAAALIVGCGSSGSNMNGGLPPAQPTGTPSTIIGGAGMASAPAVTTPVATNNTPAPMATNPGTMTTPPVTTPPATTTPPANTTPTTTPPATTTPAGMPKLAMDECGLKTNWPGDNYCINPPPADKGFQMHIGPSDYNNPDPRYVMEPGTEVTEDWPATSGNKTDVYYYWRQYRMRPGSHHLIITSTGAGAGAGFGLGARIGGSSNIAKDNPEGGIIAPENQGVGMALAANSAIDNSLHYFNFTDKPIIKEVWVNFWYRDKKDVTTPTIEMFSMLGMGIDPGQHVVKHGSCDITETGRMLTSYGHVHSHNKRFSVWRTRGGNKMLVHEAYDWTTPNVSEFSSTVMNPMLNPTAKTDGGYSGILDLMPGDSIEFECDIVNDTTATFVGQNEAQDDEMCIMIGDTVGATVPFLCTDTTLPATATD